jgi:excisionase family DNA binding protein
MRAVSKTRMGGALARLADAAEQSAQTDATTRVAVGEMVAHVPAETVALISHLLRDISEGRSVTVAPYDLAVGTEQAAGMLNVSRPWLVVMLERGDLPMQRSGSKRRVRLGDLLAYRRAEARQRGVTPGGRQPNPESQRPTSRWRSSTPPTDWSEHTGPTEGFVELPFHLYWSDDNNRFDLTKRSRLRSMYQTVLSEGSPDDVRAYINLPLLIDVWDELWLSPAVHEAWDKWTAAHRHALV